MPDEVYEASLCALVESPAVKIGGVDGYRPHMSLLAGQVHYLSATTPLKVGKPPWCCPRQAEFWRLCCTGWCAAYIMEIGATAGRCTRPSSVAGGPSRC